MRHSALLTAIFICLISLTAHAAQSAKVITKENAIRSSCRFFAPIKLKVVYQDALEVLSKEGDWYRVRFKATEGCIHSSAIEQKKFSFAGIGGAAPESGTSDDEVALAGKGFNAQVEGSYRQKNPKLDFGAMDKIETYTVSDDALSSFLKDGGLERQ